jgi:hypothetical protein
MRRLSDCLEHCECLGDIRWLRRSRWDDQHKLERSLCDVDWQLNARVPRMSEFRRVFLSRRSMISSPLGISLLCLHPNSFIRCDPCKKCRQPSACDHFQLVIPPRQNSSSAYSAAIWKNCHYSVITGIWLIPRLVVSSDTDHIADCQALVFMRHLPFSWLSHF